jgi:hypothetical protein
MKVNLGILILALFLVTILISCSGNEEEISSESHGDDVISYNPDDLTTITVSKGVLQPSFEASVTTYLDAPIPRMDTTTEITAIAADSDATIKINGADVSSGTPYTLNNLVTGSNKITIAVTSSGGSTKNYIVYVYRSIPVYKTGAGEIDGYLLDAREDGSIQKGSEWPAIRFVLNDNNTPANANDDTIKDNLSGLIWFRNANPSTPVTWYNLNNFITAFNYNQAGGFSDWQIPNVTELKSLLNYGKKNPYAWLMENGFNSVRHYYRTSTSFAVNIGYSYVSNFNAGDVYAGNKTSAGGTGDFSFFVWPARTGESLLPKSGAGLISGYSLDIKEDGSTQRGISWPIPRFYVTDETIIDNMTGLIWMKNANLAGTKNWKGSLDFITALNSANSGIGTAGHHDWRLPNVNEALTLINYGNSQPAVWLKNQGFTNVQTTYWTSTTVAYSEWTSNAWLLFTEYGEVWSTHSKANYHYVWPVCGGE